MNDRRATIYFLGIDVGTGGTRALIMDASGRVISSGTEEHVPFASPHPGWAEQDPRDWWRACCAAVKKPGKNFQSREKRSLALAFPARCTAPFCSMPTGKLSAPRSSGATSAPKSRLAISRKNSLPKKSFSSPRIRPSPISPSAKFFGSAKTSRNSGPASATLCCPRTTSAIASPATAPLTRPTPAGRCCSMSPIANGPKKFSTAPASTNRCSRAL